MIRVNQKNMDVKDIIALFGGKHAIVDAYEKILRIIITPKAIEKWLERDAISLKHLANLKKIAGRKDIEFNVEIV